MSNATPTLAAQGFVMPAEWAPHEATFLAWPHKQATWPGKFEPVPGVYAQLVRAISDGGEAVYLLVANAAMEASARAVLKQHKADASTVRFLHVPTNDVWVRDHGPIFVQSPEAYVAIDWGYNSWGGKYPPFDLDDVVPHRVGELLEVPVVDGGMILEGGSIDVNGEGLLLTTEACLLNPNRNPHLTREQIEQRLRDFLGVQKILWLGDGIVGDDTDGHVDDLTRFVSRNTIVTVVEQSEGDVNYAPLRENHERLLAMTNLEGRKFDVVSLPMPDPIEHDGQRLPASYANFYIGNGTVAVPTYDSPKQDKEAVGLLQELMPDRRVFGIRSTDLVWGLGSFHCITQQMPRRR